MIQQRIKVIEKTALTKNISRIVFETQQTAAQRPGQFVNIALDGHFLRRPISVYDCDTMTLKIVVRNVGEGTVKLCASKNGDVFDALTGLGNGYDTAACAEDDVLLAGGGVGTPPLYMLAKELVALGKIPSVALGFANAEDVILVDEFRSLGCEVAVATNDGSAGVKGFVSDLIAQRFSSTRYVFCCGPEPMLKAVHGMPQFADGQYSFERRMGCGFGACMGCSCKTKYGSKRICVDGPVLKAGEIVW